MVKGWAGFMKFDGSVQKDLDAFVKKEVTTKPKINKRFLQFGIGSLNLSKDSSGKTIYKSFLYKDIHNLSMMGKTNLYFICQKKGTVLFFQEYKESDAQLFFDYLQEIIMKYSNKK